MVAKSEGTLKKHENSENPLFIRIAQVYKSKKEQLTSLKLRTDKAIAQTNSKIETYEKTLAYIVKNFG